MGKIIHKQCFLCNIKIFKNSYGYTFVFLVICFSFFYFYYYYHNDYYYYYYFEIFAAFKAHVNGKCGQLYSEVLCKTIRPKILWKKLLLVNHHCVKSVQIPSFLWPLFSCVRTEYWKIWTRKNSVFGHFSRSAFSEVESIFQRLWGSFLWLTTGNVISNALLSSHILGCFQKVMVLIWFFFH